MLRTVAESIEPRPSREDRDRIARILAVLLSSASVRTWRGLLGSSADEAAEDVDWVLNAIIAAAARKDEK
jgi:hypothetical protein